MTVEEVKRERDRLCEDLQRVAAPLMEEFEHKTGVLAQVRTDHLEVTTFEDKRSRHRVLFRVVLDWEA